LTRSYSQVFSSSSSQGWGLHASPDLDELFKGLYAYFMRCDDVPTELLDTLEITVLGEKLAPLIRAAKRAKFNNERAARLANP